MDFKIAEKVYEIMEKISGELDESIRYVMESCSHEDFVNYRRAAGNVMGLIYMDIMIPIHDEHPKLIPESLRKPD